MTAVPPSHSRTSPARAEDMADVLRDWLPALRDVLAAAARDAEKVRRVEAVLDELELDVPAMVHIRRALDVP